MRKAPQTNAEEVQTLLLNIRQLGREYRFLSDTMRSLQNRVRAFLLKRYRDKLTEQGMASSDPGAFGNLERTVTDAALHDEGLSQERDRPARDTQCRGVPTWLRTPPKLKHGTIRKEEWRPDLWLPTEYEARLLIFMVDEEVAPQVRVKEKQLRDKAAQLPIWTEWCVHVRGVDSYGLAVLIAEMFDLWQYPTVSTVWKRLSVGLHNGERQRRHAGITQAEALAIGYEPSRRAMVYNMEVGLINQNKACVDHAAAHCQEHPGPYRRVYLARKIYEQAKAGELTKMAWHRRASRYMAKRFLRDLWIAWTHTMPPTPQALAYLAWAQAGGPREEKPGVWVETMPVEKRGRYAKRLRQAQQWTAGGRDLLDDDVRHTTVTPLVAQEAAD